jgi:hypothetical protein
VADAVLPFRFWKRELADQAILKLYEALDTFVPLPEGIAISLWQR